ncbi:MAG: CAP domain-containing protein [Halobacteriales archaeon]
MGIGKLLIWGFALVFLAAGLAGGYMLLQGSPETPEFEGEGTEYQVVNDWEDPGESDRFDYAEIEERAIEITNEFRAEEDLEPLEFHEPSREKARSHSADMASNGYVGHVDSDGDRPRDRMEDIDCTRIGENAAVALYDVREHDEWTDETEVNRDEGDVARALVHNWMASEPHRENIMDDDFTSASVGVYVSEGHAVFGTQKFCTE